MTAKRLSRPVEILMVEDNPGTVRLTQDPDDELDHALDANERGLNDTVRVNPNTVAKA